MEWVQTTGDSVDEAKDRALDELGVDEDEAEFDVLEEPSAGLFGRVRGEARVKARVRPKSPRARQERRGRGRGRGKGSKRSKGSKGADRSGGRERASRDEGSPATTDGASGIGEPTADRAPAQEPRPQEQSRRKPKKQTRPDRAADQQEKTVTEDVSIEEQGEIVADFLEGLVGAFGAEGEVAVEEVDEGTIELRVEGEDLGPLVGPKGRTLSAVHELSKTVLQREVAGGSRGRIRVDIAGYRERRRAALTDFARVQAEGVIDSGMQRALEPMGAADRKVVHDAVNEIDGVSTISEGEDPRRRVVLVPEED